MGMYTGLRGKIKLTPRVAKLFSQWESLTDLSCSMSPVSYEIDNIREKYSFNVWAFIAEALANEQIYSYAQDMRSNFIPYGVLCYMPDDWGEDSFVTLEDNELQFACSLKNYSDTIGEFVRHVLPVIAISWDLEQLYEEDSTPTIIRGSI